MELEKVLVAGIIGLSAGGATYYVINRISNGIGKVYERIQTINEDTTKLLDSFTHYLVPYVKTKKELNAFRELVRTRVEMGM